MIKLTRLNGKTLHLNAVFIETVESFPDTTISLTNGKKYIVKENEDQVVRLIEEFYRRIQVFHLNSSKEDEKE